jgi:hypothetical protein
MLVLTAKVTAAKVTVAMEKETDKDKSSCTKPKTTTKQQQQHRIWSETRRASRHSTTNTKQSRRDAGMPQQWEPTHMWEPSKL